MPSVKLFISYRHNDGQEDVYLIYQGLIRFFRKGLTFFDDSNLRPGENFVKWIERSVKACDVVIVVIGKQWLTLTDEEGRQKLANPKDFVLLEVASALTYGKKIIPLILSGAPIPREEQLPASIKELASINAVKFPDRSDTAAWTTALSQTISVLVKEFPFYKDWLFWLTVFVWPAMIGAGAFYSHRAVEKIAGWLHLTLPPIANVWIYYIATALIWSATYILHTARDYEAGKTDVLLVPVSAYGELFSDIFDTIESFFLGFPTNIFLAWLIASAVNYVVVVLLHLNIGFAFLVAYLILHYNMIVNFTSGYGIRRDRRYEDLFRPETTYEAMMNKNKLAEHLKKNQIRSEKAKQFWPGQQTRIRKQNDKDGSPPQ